MKFNITCITAAVALSVFGGSAAQAQQAEGWYAAGSLGYNRMQDETINGIGASFGRQPGGSTNPDGGELLSGSVGWAFSNGLRLELEGSFARNDISSATAGSLHDAPASGGEDKTSLFANALYDFGKTSWGIAPYAGIGVGSTRAKWRNLQVSSATETVGFDDSVSKAAYQGILGFSFLDNAVPGCLFTLEYRYRALDGGRTYSGEVERSRIGAFPVTADLGSSHDQALTFGVRYQFGARAK